MANDARQGMGMSTLKEWMQSLPAIEIGKKTLAGLGIDMSLDGKGTPDEV
jgi:hypothetical protein